MGSLASLSAMLAGPSTHDADASRHVLLVLYAALLQPELTVSLNSFPSLGYTAVVETSATAASSSATYSVTSACSSVAESQKARC